jgi:hypothetical protein
MGFTRSVGRRMGERIAPSVASQYVRAILDKAIDGVGPLRSAAESADAKLVDAGGDVEAAVAKLVRFHAALAGAQGFVTNLGGVAALAVALPANVVGVTLVQCHPSPASLSCAGTTSTIPACATPSWSACSARMRPRA